jgi:FkbM family methyltransferase
MTPLELIIQNPVFKKTSLYRSFKQKPLGFIDLGSAGEIHPLISPVAPLTHCTCFEPGEKACGELRKKYARSRFAKLSILNSAIGRKTGQGKLYITQSPVNSSLLKPNQELTRRYNMMGFQVQKVLTIKTGSLDDIVFNTENGKNRVGEFIKMDCQGVEYDIIKGARRVLREQCVALWCELEFFRMYEKQKIFSEVDLWLRKEGFQLYGLYPNYLSAKKIDRKKGDTEERLTWADALYFKDPLSDENRQKPFSKRDMDVLLLVAILTGFNDYALELIDCYYKTDRPDHQQLQKLVITLGESQKKCLEEDLSRLLKEVQETPERGYLLAKKFIDKHGSNNNSDFLTF